MLSMWSRNRGVTKTEKTEILCKVLLKYGKNLMVP